MSFEQADPAKPKREVAREITQEIGDKLLELLDEAISAE
jgi:hypothetical protein